MGEFGYSTSTTSGGVGVAERRLPGVFDELRPPLDDGDAVVEADLCLECGGPYAPAPCAVACPASIDVPGFISAIAAGDTARAARLIFAENLLGGSCARVCPVEELCEGACVLKAEGRRPVQVARLQRYAADWGLARGLPVRDPSPVRPGRRGTVAVIGAGPTGLACAGELAARGHRVVVYEARDDFGGLLRYAIAPYRQVREPLPAEARAIGALGVEFRLGEAIDTAEGLRAIEVSADAVFLGVGLGEDMDVRYPGDELRGVWQSLPFIETMKMGLPPALGDHVVVIGGGNTAIDVAREARRLGASEVTILYRRTEEEMPAYPHEVEEAREEGVQFQWLTNPVRFLGGDRLTGIACQRMRLGAPDGSGRPRPEPVPDSEFTIRAETAVKAIGQRKRTDFLSWIDGLAGESLLSVDPETGQTKNPKYFAAGDAVNGGATVVEAVRGAKIAARGIDRYLRGRTA